MNSKVEAAIDAVISREGGYSDHPADRGGKTRWGITEAVARQNGYAGDMRALPRQLARDIYLRRYWIEPGFAAIEPLSMRIAEECFDTGVNMGPGVAAAMLQRALNVFNRQGQDYPDVAVDGRIGPATLAALTAFLRIRGAQGETALLRALNCLQGTRYIEIMERNPGNEAFALGWFLHRVST